MIAASAVLSAATLAAVWDEIGYLVLIPTLLLAPFGVFFLWFLWAWIMVSKGYLPSASTVACIVILVVASPILWLITYNLAQSTLVPHPKVIIIVALALVFLAAFLLPERRVD
jgi:hypothetical protein